MRQYNLTDLTVINYGQPRVGNMAFGDYLRKVLPRHFRYKFFFAFVILVAGIVVVACCWCRRFIAVALVVLL
jgi:hypothetical protein